MMRGFLIAFFFLAGVALAQETPESNPSEVWVKGRQVRHSWRGGRIWVATSDLKVLLNMDSEYKDMDLLKALEEKGGYVWGVTDGKFEAKRDRSQYGKADTRRARAANRRISRATKRRPSKREKAKSKDLGLKYEVVEIDTDWGYKWGAVKVTNVGSRRSDVCKAFCEFQDGFGRTYAEDWWPVKSLQPGESVTFPIASGKRVEETSMTPTDDNIAVYFFSQEDAAKNPTSMREARKQARKNKKSRGIKRKKVDFTPRDYSKPGIGL